MCNAEKHKCYVCMSCVTTKQSPPILCYLEVDINFITVMRKCNYHLNISLPLSGAQDSCQIYRIGYASGSSFVFVCTRSCVHASATTFNKYITHHFIYNVQVLF